MFRQDGFRVELNTEYGQAPVPYRHRLVVLAHGVDFKVLRKAFGIDDKRVITDRAKRTGNLLEYAEAVVENHRGLPVHQPPCQHYLAAEGFGDRLVAQTYSKDRNPAREPAYGLYADARLFRRARPRRNDERARFSSQAHRGRPRRCARPPGAPQARQNTGRGCR